MKKISILITLLNCFLSYSQVTIPCAGKIYETSCNSRIVVIRKDSLQLNGYFSESIQYCKKILDSCERMEELYRMAISYTKLNEWDSAYFFLNKYIDISADDRLILVDKDLEPLRENRENWNKIQKKIEQVYISELDSGVNKEVALKLFYMGIEDQKYRAILPALGQVEFDSNGLFRVPVSMEMMDQLEEIIKKYGFPGISLAGKLGSKNAFLILQHSFKIKKYYKQVKKLYEKGDFSPTDYAMLTDRYLMDKNRKQIYGTQLEMNPRKTGGYYVLYPVKDFKNVNKRRKDIGFASTVEEYVASWKDGKHIIPEKYYRKKR